MIDPNDEDDGIPEEFLPWTEADQQHENRIIELFDEFALITWLQ